jgi:hypothetical protein
MDYESVSLFWFNSELKTESEVINFLWSWKLDKNDFSCDCGHKKFYQHRARPEVRECCRCGKQHRLRAGTIFENSKVKLRHWMNALLLMMSGKRGISALELQKHLGINSYKTAWGMLQKIRRALIERDQNYKLDGTIEVDGSHFGNRATGNSQGVIIGVESKQWVDEKGRTQEKAGFAQIMLGEENKSNVKKFVKEKLSPHSELHVDGAKSYEFPSRKVEIESKITLGNKEVLQDWHPWVFRFVSNAKVWILGTHHGIRKKYLTNYLGEYTYRFNRRHAPKELFSRALRACMLAGPVTLAQICRPLPAYTGE